MSQDTRSVRVARLAGECLDAPLGFGIGRARDVGARDPKLAQLVLGVLLELGKGCLEGPVLGPGKSDRLKQVHCFDLRQSRHRQDR